MNEITQPIVITPDEIEGRSFAIIEEEFYEQTSLHPQSLNTEMFQIIRRVIHATGDFSFATSLVFQPDSIRAGVCSIQSGRDIFIDVGMGASGINRALLKSFGGSVRCHINDPGIAESARKAGRTRTETAVRSIKGENVGIIAVGNAPTALMATMKLIEKEEITPDLVIGVPVGFVNASESKEMLAQKDYPFITNAGRKGGSPVAVAIVNALLRLA
jgi:precorrin-8X/cobalt-precorrin-8 methylmutase